METHRLPFLVSASWLFFTDSLFSTRSGPVKPALSWRRSATLPNKRIRVIFHKFCFFSRWLACAGNFCRLIPTILKILLGFFLFSSLFFCFFLLPLFTLNCTCVCSSPCVSSPDRRRDVAQRRATISPEHSGERGVQKHFKTHVGGSRGWKIELPWQTQ